MVLYLHFVEAVPFCCNPDRIDIMTSQSACTHLRVFTACSAYHLSISANAVPSSSILWGIAIPQEYNTMHSFLKHPMWLVYTPMWHSIRADHRTLGANRKHAGICCHSNPRSKMRLVSHSMRMRETLAIRQERVEVLQCVEEEKNRRNGASFGLVDRENKIV